MPFNSNTLPASEPMQPIRSDRPLLRTLLGAVLGLAVAAPAHALKVFTCEPEWAALVKEIAPDADVRSATHSRQDPHHIEARPSLISALRRADLAVCTGAELEAGWLPMLQQRAGNPRVQDRQPGMFYAADYVTLIDPRPPGGLFDGDVHPGGNPHFHLDPHRLLEVAEGLAERMQEIDPANAARYGERLSAFSAAWKTRIAQWEARAAALKGKQMAAQHTTFAYLWNWLGIRQIADLEPKPGMPPTPGHLQRVLGETRNQPLAVVVSSYQDPRPAQWLAQQLGGGVAVLQLPATVEEEGRTSELAGLFDHLIDRLLAQVR